MKPDFVILDALRRLMVEGVPFVQLATYYPGLLGMAHLRRRSNLTTTPARYSCCSFAARFARGRIAIAVRASPARIAALARAPLRFPKGAILRSRQQSHPDRSPRFNVAMHTKPKSRPHLQPS